LDEDGFEAASRPWWTQPRDDPEDLESAKKAYAAALSAVAPDQLRITFDVIHECQFFCIAPRLPERSVWRSSMASQQEPAESEGCVRSMLQRRYGQDACLGSSHKAFTDQRHLVDTLLAGGFNSAGNSLGGFVTIRGGVETKKNDGVLDRSMFGFCFQRTRIDASLLGPWTDLQAELQTTEAVSRRHAGANLETRSQLASEAKTKLLRDISSRVQTVSCNSFRESTETLGLDYFRFLYLERGLRQFDILHFIEYDHRKFLSAWLDDMCQQRHALRHVPGSGLRRNGQKLASYTQLSSLNFLK
jgi:hypothetical protein